ncbi:MAG TPA: hypothetical protein VK971_09660 [Thiohalobacter sp.]|nr:hypothetical protein [Thiohalobacter sp.]
MHTSARPRDPVAQGTGDFPLTRRLLNAWAALDAQRGETVQAIPTVLSRHAIRHERLQRIRCELFEDFQKELEPLSRLEDYMEES